MAGRIDLLVINADVCRSCGGVIPRAGEVAFGRQPVWGDPVTCALVRRDAVSRRPPHRNITVSSLASSRHHTWPVLASKHALEGYPSLDHEVRHAGVRDARRGPPRLHPESHLVRADRQLDDYCRRATAESVMRGQRQLMPPEVKVCKAWRLRRTKCRAPAMRRWFPGGRVRQVSLLRRFVPRSAFDKSLRKQMRLPNLAGIRTQPRGSGRTTSRRPNVSVHR